MCSSTDATPPVMIYANAAFCSLTNFSLVLHPRSLPNKSRVRQLTLRLCVCVSCGTHVPQDQLLGAPFQFSFVVNVHQYKQAVILTTNRYFSHFSD
jgi:hypothetical protein